MAENKKTDKPQAEGQSGSEAQPENPSRRSLLKGAGLVGAAGLGGAGALVGQSAQASDRIRAREALEVLTAEEAVTLEAICDRLIPADETGPGAREARAVHYIDRSLASHNAGLRHSYLVGIAALNDYCRQTRGRPFAELITDQQDSILLAMQQNKLSGFEPSAGAFFNVLRSHTIDGTFSDPYYGGNRNFVGWDLLRYPGIRLGASVDEVAAGNALGGNHQSAYDYRTYTKGNDDGGGR